MTYGGCDHQSYQQLPLQDKLGRDVTAQTAKLAEAVSAASQKVLDANTKYAADQLKGFEQGGRYADATIQQAQQQMQQVEAAVVAVRLASSALCYKPSKKGSSLVC